MTPQYDSKSELKLGMFCARDFSTHGDDDTGFPIVPQWMNPFRHHCLPNINSAATSQ